VAILRFLYKIPVTTSNKNSQYRNQNVKKIILKEDFLYAHFIFFSPYLRRKNMTKFSLTITILSNKG